VPGIKDKVVVITGASSGNGTATARRLAAEGANVVLGARRLDRLQALADELSLGDQAVVKTDVTQYEQVVGLVDHAVDAYGRIDVIINNAGVMPHSPLERRKVEDWERSIDVNLKGTLYGIAATSTQRRVVQIPGSCTEACPRGSSLASGGSLGAGMLWSVTTRLAHGRSASVPAGGGLREPYLRLERFAHSPEGYARFRTDPQGPGTARRYGRLLLATRPRSLGRGLCAERSAFGC
jgi:NAD(P)-dependent dehydrogenase (short-subunit alcohol dehydrogenase family)